MISLCDRIIIGINNDDYVSEYKRCPIQTQGERLEAIRVFFGSKIYALEIVGPSQLKLIIQKYNVTHIFHGTDRELTSYKKQIRYYEDGLDKLNISIEMIPYTEGISTTLILSNLEFYKNLDGILFDLDNTLLLNDMPTNEAVECVEFIQKHNIEIKVITNNNNYTPKQISSKLCNIGMHINEEQIYSPLKHIKLFLNANSAYKNIYVWGSNNAIQYLCDNNFNIINDMNAADIFIVLYNAKFQYNDLSLLVTRIKKNKIPYIIGNIDLTYPDKDIILPHTGAIYNLIFNITNISPILICGKPYFSGINIEPNKKYIIVGDNISTDGKLAENMNVHFFHKTDLFDLGILLKKLKLALS